MSTQINHLDDEMKERRENYMCIERVKERENYNETWKITKKEIIYTL